MKNVLSTFAMLAVLGVLGYFGWSYYQSKERAAEPLTGDGFLAPEKQQVIWDAEHVTFEVEHRLGKAFLEAWQSQDVKKLTSLLHPDFQAVLPQTTEWTVISKPPLEEKIRLSPRLDEEPLTADTNEFLKVLLDPIRDVKIKKKKLRVLKISDMGKGLWSCRFLLAGSGVDGNSVSRHYESEHDVCLEIKDEKKLGEAASILQWEVRTETQRRCDKPIMEEITSLLGLDQSGLKDNWDLEKGKAQQHNFQVAVEDFDLDNDLDISVMTVDGKRYLFAFEDGKYKNVTKELGIPMAGMDPMQMDIFSTAWIDIDNDGYPELISGARVFKNIRGELFKDITTETRLLFDPEVMGLNVVDFNNDGFLDLYVVYQRPYGIAAKTDEGREAASQQARWIDEETSGKVNELFKNNGDGTFRMETLLSGTGGGKRHSQAAAWFFYDDDIYPDVYIANDFGKNVLLRNGGPGEPFEDVSVESGTNGFATSMGVVAGDVDNDGESDLFVANMFSKMGRRIIEMVSPEDYTPEVHSQIVGSCAGNRLYRRTGPDGKYEDSSVASGVNEVGWAWAPTMADLDSDGWLDLYSTSGFMSFDRKKPDG
ncbi:MAG: FG-GAP repeat domain-containing protein [Mariniblastus sp.]